MKRVSGRSAAQAAELAGADMLKSLEIAERVLDGDQDARLITRTDGVVIYANAAYFTLAREAGVMGPAGLPPRIDRLFAQQGAPAEGGVVVVGSRVDKIPLDVVVAVRDAPSRSRNRRQRAEPACRATPSHLAQHGLEA